MIVSHKELSLILTNHFALDLRESGVDSESAYLKFLQTKLAVKVEQLIINDLEKLLQILYRIDVSQKYSDEAFELGEVKKVSMKLSELIIKRQLKKITYARKFNQEES